MIALYLTSALNLCVDVPSWYDEPPNDHTWPLPPRRRHALWSVLLGDRLGPGTAGAAEWSHSRPAAGHRHGTAAGGVVVRTDHPGPGFRAPPGGPPGRRRHRRRCRDGDRRQDGNGTTRRRLRFLGPGDRRAEQTTEHGDGVAAAATYDHWAARHTTMGRQRKGSRLR